jgi:hypothetical protein
LRGRRFGNAGLAPHDIAARHPDIDADSPQVLGAKRAVHHAEARRKRRRRRTAQVIGAETA